MAEMAFDIKIPNDKLIEFPYRSVLEPTPGLGNLVGALNDIGSFSVYGPSGDFWDSWGKDESKRRFDYVVMNPPFTPYQEMDRFINRSMDLSDIIIALLPVNVLTSHKRLTKFQSFGLVSITMLSRNTFYNKVAVCIIKLEKGFKGQTIFKSFIK